MVDSERETRETDRKFNREQTVRSLMGILDLYLDSKVPVPHFKLSEAFVQCANRLDPSRKLSRRQLAEKILEGDPETAKTLADAVMAGRLISDEELDMHVANYCRLFKGALQDASSASFDAWEHHTQQLISVLHLANIEKFFAKCKSMIEGDPTCPYLIKRYFDSMVLPMARSIGNRSVTPEQQGLAEQIMGLVDAKLEKDRPDIFRALTDSLKWRDVDDLKRTLEAVKNTPVTKKKLGLFKSTEGRGAIRGRESCLFIETADAAHYIG